MEYADREREKGKLKIYVLLHALLLVYSLSSVCSKLAGQYAFLSFGFCAYYAALIFLLGLYAIGWQQIIKRLPLSTAFANKAVSVIWGCVWGMLIFHERLTLGKVIGCLLVLCGVAIYGLADGKTEEGPHE